MKTLSFILVLLLLSSALPAQEIFLKRNDLGALQTRAGGWHTRAEIGQLPGVRVRGDFFVINPKDPQLEVTGLVLKGESLNGSLSEILIDATNSIKDPLRIQDITRKASGPTAAIHAGGGTLPPPVPRLDVSLPSGIHAGGGNTRTNFME